MKNQARRIRATRVFPVLYRRPPQKRRRERPSQRTRNSVLEERLRESRASQITPVDPWALLLPDHAARTPILLRIHRVLHRNPSAHVLGGEKQATFPSATNRFAKEFLPI